MKNETQGKPIDEILSILNSLRIVTDISEFEKWMKRYHGRKLDKNILEGYRFFLTTVFRCLISQIEQDSSLGLKEDYTFFRARFIGIPIEDVPNTCEKTIFIKNLWRLTKPIRKSKNWEEMKESIKEIEPLLNFFEELYNLSHVSTKIDKEKALKVITEYYTLIFFNDISKGLPLGYIYVSTLPPTEKKEHYKEIFKGYVYTLQFLWFKLIGIKKFKNSSIKNLHNAYKIYKSKIEREYRSKEGVREVPGYKEWMALDHFFPIINEEIIQPALDELGKNLPFESLFFINKNLIKEFTKKDELKEPSYLRRKTLKDIKRWLNYKLLWYDVEVLSSTGSIFSGVPAFISILVGLTKLSEDKVLVKIFKHPEKGTKGYRYSYGILVPSFGLSGIADYSGWLIFFSCATDFSGFGGSLYREAQTFINSLKNKGKIEVEEIEVDESIFQEYLEEKSISFSFDRIVSQISTGKLVDISKIKHELNMCKREISKIKLKLGTIKEENKQFTNSTRGILFELIAYAWLNEQMKFDKIFHNRLVNGKGLVKGEEIDIYALDGNKICLFECMINIKGEKEAKKRLKQVRKKVKALKSKYPQSEIIPGIVVYYPIIYSIKRLFAENRIEVIDNLRNEIRQYRDYSRDWKKKVFKIFGDNQRP